MSAFHRVQALPAWALQALRASHLEVVASGLFLSHLLTVVRDTPKVCVKPRILERSWWALSSSSFFLLL